MKLGKYNILGIIIIIVFMPVLIINLTLIIKSQINPDEAPDFLGYKPFIVLSGSMEPTIMTGDIAIIKKCNVNELKTGDVIAFKNGTSVITHRIIEISEVNGEKQLITKGDNNNTEDRYPVDFSKVEGIYVTRIPKLGNFAMFLQTTIGAIIFICIPFVLYIALDMVQRKKISKLQAEKQHRLEKEIQELKKEKITK